MLKSKIKVINGDEYNRDDDIKLLTSCPACQQGLARYTDDTGLKADYIVIEMADRLYGKDWEKQFIRKATDGGIEKVLL